MLLYTIVLDLNSFPARGELCRLLMIFANSLDPDQARQNVGPDLDPNRFKLLLFSWNMFWKYESWKKSADDKTSWKIT